MRRYRTALLLAAFSLLAILRQASWATTPDWMQREGTIKHVLISESTHAYIDAVIVDKIKADEGYFTVKEPYSSADRLVILSPPSPLLRRGQLLDIEGDRIILSDNRGVALTNVTVYGYATSEGVLLTRGGPVSKGILRKTFWARMTDITVRPATTNPLSDEPNDSPAEQPSYYPTIADILEGNSTVAQESPQRMQIESLYDGIPDLNGLPDGSLVELQCKRITGVGTELIDGTTYHYIDISEDLPATDTIRCYYSGTPTVTAADRINKITGQIRYVDTTEVICVDDGYGYAPQTLEGKIQVATVGSIAYARTCPDNTTVTLSSKVIIADRTDLSGDRLYIEESNRSAGILIIYSGIEEASRGTTIDIAGTIDTLPSGERWIDAGSNGITVVTPGLSLPTTVGMNNRACGGTDFNVLTPGVNTPNGYVLYNIGLLVKTWGKVSEIYPSEKCFYLNDGSNLDDTTHTDVLGLKVSWEQKNISAGNPEIAPPIQGQFVYVTGISSAESPDGSKIIRVLRIRNQADIVQLQDDTPPEVTISYPDLEVRKFPDALIPIIGTATDLQSGIASVQVKHDSGQWEDVAYQSGNRTWSHSGWNLSAGQHVIMVKATNYAGTETLILEEVNVVVVTESDFFSSLVTYCQGE
jgi:hypothetical protein